MFIIVVDGEFDKVVIMVPGHSIPQSIALMSLNFLKVQKLRFIWNGYGDDRKTMPKTVCQYLFPVPRNLWRQLLEKNDLRDNLSYDLNDMKMI